MNSINILYQNVRGLRTKTSDLLIKSSNKADIYCLTETWLCSGIGDTELFDSSYQVFRRDRYDDMNLRTLGGGVLIATKTTYCCKRITIPHISSCLEYLCVCIQIVTGCLFLFNVYIPPTSAVSYYNNFIECIIYISKIRSDGDEILVLGDFNLPLVEWVPSDEGDYLEPSNITSEVESFTVDNMTALGFQQINDIKNHNGRLLDLVFTANTLDCLVTHDNTFLTEDKHHPTLMLSINLHVTTNTTIYGGFYDFNFRRADYDKINSSLQNYDWNLLYDCKNFNEAIFLFYELMYSCFIKSVPLYCKQFNISDHPWYDNDLRSLRNCRNRAWKSYCKCKTDSNLMIYNNLSRHFNDCLARKYNLYLANLESNLTNNPRDFWNFLKNKRINRGYPSRMDYNHVCAVDSKSISNLFADYFKTAYDTNTRMSGVGPNMNHIQTFDFLGNINFFISIDNVRNAIMKCKNDYSCGPDGIPSAVLKHCTEELVLPLSFLFNKSLSTAIFPAIWKKSFVVPIYKKGGRSDIKNYRPIAKLSSIPKIFESLITDTLTFNIKSILCPQQHGFVKGRSTTTNLLEFVTYCFDNFNNRSQVDCIFTDFSKAFDKLSHDLLLTKLSKLGFNRNFVSWISSYLSPRSCRVVFSDALSYDFEITSGVPQGSHMGPIFFILYINDLPSVIVNSECKIYADDVKIFKSVSSISDAEQLQGDLSAFHKWCVDNHMFLNIDKCRVINLTRKNLTLLYLYHINDAVLINVDKMLDLGIYIDKRLSFKCHVDYMINKANMVMGFIIREGREFSDPYCLKAMFLALVRSILEYSCQVWSPYYTVDILRIESIQRRFLRFALRKLPWSDLQLLPSYEHRLKLLNMPTLNKHRDYLRISFVCNIINGIIDCPNILAKLNLNINVRNLRKIEFFNIGHYHSNYGRFSPLNSMLILYNSNSDFLLNNNVKSVDFMSNFYK